MTQPTPDFAITLDGKELTTRLAPRLVSLTITECRNDEADTLDIVLDDSDGKLALPKRGAVLAASIGWTGQPLVNKGTFTVDEIEYSGAPDVITLRARSASMTKDMGERLEKSWHKVTISAIVIAIAGKHKLKPVIGPALAKIAIPHIDQTHESDMAFLTRLAKRYDAVMTVKEGRLLFMPIGMGVTASGKDLQAILIDRSAGDQHRYHVAERENYAGVRAYWHSGAKGKRKNVIVGGENNHNIKVLPETYATEAEAKAAATSEFKRTKRGQATMNYTLGLGRPEIRPELPVIVTGFKPEIDETDWLVRRSTHTLSDGGLGTSLELEMSDDPASDRHRTNFGKVKR
jgi:phage protein D